MSWKNFGFNKKNDAGEIIERCWTLDHCIPCMAVDVSRKDHLELLWDIRNLRPMWHTENLQKLNKIDLSAIHPDLLEKARALGIKLK